MRRRLRVTLATLLGSLSLLLLAVPGTQAQSVDENDRAALKALYTATDGANWTTRTGWNAIDTATDLGTLHGVSVDTGSRRVTRIDLRSNNLTGAIPNLSRLARLRTLWLSRNQLRGSIPTTLPPSLTQLLLDNNQLIGPIPNLSSLTSLQHLYLDNNQLTGRIPASLGSLTGLQRLYLYKNQLTGPIPDLSSLTGLQRLYLYNNQLGLDTNGQKLTTPLAGLANKLPAATLTFLYLNNNHLTDAIPDLSSLTALQHLSLNNNDLSGAIPDLSSLTSLQQLYLHDNDLSGAIPTSLARDTLPGLTWLSLYGNPGLYGYPTELDDDSRLYLRVSGDGTAVCLPTALGVSDCTVPTLVDNLRVQASPTQLVFNWTPHPATPAPSGYEVWYYPPGGPWTQKTHSDASTTTTLTGLTPGAEYFFLVRTTNSGTPWLGSVAATRLRAPAPLTVTADNGKLNLIWTAPTGTVTGYDVEYRTTDAPDQPATAPDDPTTGWVAVTRIGTTTVRVISGLTNGTTYNVRVRAKNTTDNGVWAGEWATRQGTPRRPSSPRPPTRQPGPPGNGGGGGGGGGSRTPDDRHADTWDAATALTPAGHTGALARTINAHLQDRQDVDYFTLDLPYAGVLTASTTGETDTTGRLYEAQAEGAPLLITEDTDGGPFQLGVAVEPGTYYLAVSAGTGSGAYTLTVHYTPAFVENPAPASPQSGVSVLSGWVCEADTVEIALTPAGGAPVTLLPATGTARADTAGVCGAATTDTGFGLLFNWNLLGDGAHMVRVLIDDVLFAERQITVTTLGEHEEQEFRRGLRGTSTISDFPDMGQTTTLRWEEALQNFVIAAGERARGGAQLTPEQARLENPASGSFQSGIGVISGWVCEADTVEIVFEPGGTADTLPFEAGYGTDRADTADRCGDTDNGFGLLFNWNLLGDGQHTVRAYADGQEFAHSTVTVTPLAGEFAEGLRRTHPIADFPAAGQTTTVEWREGQQNFVITGVE